MSKSLEERLGTQAMAKEYLTFLNKEIQERSMAILSDPTNVLCTSPDPERIAEEEQTVSAYIYTTARTLAQLERQEAEAELELRRAKAHAHIRIRSDNKGQKFTESDLKAHIEFDPGVMQAQSEYFDICEHVKSFKGMWDALKAKSTTLQARQYRANFVMRTESAVISY